MPPPPPLEAQVAKQKDDTGDPVLKGWRVHCSLPRGIRRGGRYWRFGEQVIGAGDLLPVQLDALRADPAFTVEAIHE